MEPPVEHRLRTCYVVTRKMAFRRKEDMSKPRWIIRLSLLAFVLIWSTSAGFAQLTRGFVSGIVTDASGSILPRVEVTITNKATNIARNASTNDSGSFPFAGVEPGEYAVACDLNGFETARIDPISVNTAQEVTLNQTLTIAGTSSEVVVTEVPGAELSKSTPTIERTFSGRLIEDLPF